MDKLFQNKRSLITIILIIIVVIIGYFVFIEKENNPTEEQAQEKENKMARYSEEFEEMIVGLKTPENIIKFVNDNFEYDYRKGNKAIAPEKLLELEKGGPQDLAAFVSYALHQNNYIAFTFVHEDKDNTYYAVSFRDDDLPKYIYFDKEGAHMIHHGWSFGDLCKKEEERLNIKILRYGTVSPTSIKLIPNEWVNY
ncbi:MAG: hypothetical protein PHX85_02265 [Methanobacteriaceae archaeon]|nr:hypothetical protein [Methanobacteriaceae archaeon]